MHRAIRSVSRLGQRVLIFFVEDVSTLWYIVGFVVVVILFGFLYTWLTPMGHGIGQDLELLPDVTFSTGIYFSIVTISSLGYGHMHPMGFSRALACIEVLIGLAMIGIMIAKVTSQRLSYHVLHLFVSDAQKRLEDIAVKFDTSRFTLRDKIMPRLATAYQSAPGQTVLLTEEKSTLISNFREAISDLQSECIKLHDYFLLAIGQENYFQIVPSSAVVRVGKAVDSAFWILGQLITSLSTQSKIEIFDDHNRQMIFEAINSQKKACNLVNEYATDQDTLDVFQRIKETCELVQTSYVAGPEESQPDQVLLGTDEPQERSREEDEQTDSP